MVYLIVIVVIVIGVVAIVASMFWEERQAARRGLSMRRKMDWGEVYTKITGLITMIAVVAALVVAFNWMQDNYRSWLRWGLGFPERYAVFQISYTVAAVTEERQRVNRRWLSIYPSDNTVDSNRLHAALERDCSVAIGTVATKCRTITTLQRRVDDLDVLSDQLRLILFENDPQGAILPAGSEPFLPSMWRTLFYAAFTDNEKNMVHIRVNRAFQSGVDTQLHRSDLIAFCESEENILECVSLLEDYAQGKGVQIIDDTPP